MVKLFYVLFALLLTACSSELTPVTGCEPQVGLQPYCLFQSPEDLAATPDGKFLIVSEMGDMHGHTPGALVLFNPELSSVEPLFPFKSYPSSAELDASWGHPQCLGIPDARFSPHGIDLVQREDGRWQLFVVNHGDRETVEFFEVVAGPENWRLLWRGCVPVANDEFLNDVAGLRNGGFVASHMFNKHEPEFLGLQWGMWQALAGFNVGGIVQWLPGGEPALIAGTEAPFVNGLVLSPDEKVIYANIYPAGEVRRINRATGKVLAVARVPMPDNSTWSSDGRILVASHQAGTADMQYCVGLPREAVCPFAFAVYSIDPLTMRAEKLFSHQGAPMGAATVALELQNSIFMGSFQGDRLLEWRR